MRDGAELEKDLKDLELGTSLKMIYKNRSSRRKLVSRYEDKPKRGGGVAIVFDKTWITLDEYKMDGNSFEVVAASGREGPGGRMLFVIAIYIPPRMRVGTFRAVNEMLIDNVSKMKVKHEDAIIILGGDMNRRDFSLLTAAYPDLCTVCTAPTRGTQCLDLLATNIEAHRIDLEVCPPLETENGERKSDYNIIFSSYAIPKKCKTAWCTYQARERTDEGKKLFSKLLLEQNWSEIYSACDPSKMVASLNTKIEEIMSTCFPLKTYRVRESDPPWMTHGLRKKISQRKEIYYTDQKKTERWRKMKRLTDSLVKEKKKEFVESMK